MEDDFVQVMRWLIGDVSTEGNLLKNLAHAFMNDSREGPFKYNPDTKGEELVNACHDTKADGVVFCAASFCDPGLLEQPLLQKICDKHNLAFTAFQFSENTGQYAVIREQVGTFSDSIKLWGEA